MRLAEFIAANTDVIVARAVSYARTLPPLVDEDEESLRDHIPKILQAIVLDIQKNQTTAQSHEKSIGTAAPRGLRDPDTAAETHGRQRAKSGLGIAQLVAEYRALRASVLALWTDAHPGGPVSDMVRFNEAIDQAIAESVAYFSGEVEQLRNLFLGVLGHDLRGPLNAILLTSELIATLAKDPEISAPVGTLIKSGQRMASLLDTLLEYNKSTLGGGMLIHRSSLDLGAECCAELELLRAALPGAELNLRCYGDLTGEFDGSRVREVLANLVSNAVSYGDGATVDIALTESGGMVSLAVSNTGPDIPAAELSKLFEPLRRGSNPAQTQRTNLGLGLFIVAQIAHAHGGNIECESNSGFTVFKLTLPKHRPEQTGGGS